MRPGPTVRSVTVAMAIAISAALGSCAGSPAGVAPTNVVARPTPSADSSAPIAIRAFPTGRADRISDLVAGYVHTCALLADGHVRCWGENANGELGDGTTTTRSTPTTPTLDGVVQLAAAGIATCARRWDGSVWCWGAGTLAPREIEAARGATFVAVGSSFACAVLSDRAPRCWPNAPPKPGSLALDADGGPRAAVEIAVGLTHACVRVEDGRVRCFGAPLDALGAGVASPDAARGSGATWVTGIDDAVELSARGSLTCARRASGSVACWGDAPGFARLRPIEIVGVSAARAIRVVDGGACALVDGGAAICWGKALARVRGAAPSSADGVFPLRAIASASALAVGREHACFVVRRAADADEARCIGPNLHGELGNGRVRSSGSDRVVLVPGVEHAKQLVATRATTYALLDDGRVIAWGAKEDQSGILGREPVDGFVDVAQIAAGDGVVCARLRSGGVRCIGRGWLCGDGVLGIGDVANHAVAVAGIRDAEALFSHAWSTCARLRDKTFRCWGDRLVPKGTEPWQVLRPTAVPEIAQALDLAGSSTNACAVFAGGTLRCWGTDVAGSLAAIVGAKSALGMSSVASPTVVSGWRNVTSVAMRHNYGCAAFVDGSAKCWGASVVNGAVAIGVEPAPVSNVAELATYSDDVRMCARLRDGSVQCWNSGALGAPPSAPTVVEGAVGVTGMAVGKDHACVIAAGGAVGCWGDDSAAQLDGEPRVDEQPVRVGL